MGYTTHKLKSQALKAGVAHAKKMLAEDKVLVYHYRANGKPVVKNGLAVVLRGELEEILRANPNLQMTTKPIPSRARSVDVYQKDLSVAQPSPYTPTPTPTTTATATPVPVGEAVKTDVVVNKAGKPEVQSNGMEGSNVAGVNLPIRIWLEGIVRGKGKGFGELVVLSEKVGV